MRVCVVGCGAVGSLFAANLAQLDDVEVWAYDQAKEHVDAINAHGLKITGAAEFTARPRACTGDTGALCRRAAASSSPGRPHGWTRAARRW